MTQREYVDLERVIWYVVGELRDFIFPADIPDDKVRLSFVEMHREIEVDVVVLYRILCTLEWADFVECVGSEILSNWMMSVRIKCSAVHHDVHGGHISINFEHLKH